MAPKQVFLSLLLVAMGYMMGKQGSQPARSVTTPVPPTTTSVTTATTTPALRSSTSAAVADCITPPAVPAAVDAQPAASRNFTLEDEWIRTKFKASDPTLQEWCTTVLLTGAGGTGQFGQDVFAARNLFFSGGELTKGFYIEAGANEYKSLSTTYFFDKCLGWSGLCIEPQPQYHKELTEKRSCTLIPKCLTDKPTKMLIGDGSGGSIKPYTEGMKVTKGLTVVDCEPLDMILTNLKLPSNHVDLFVLDVEGAERMVLDSLPWSNLDISTFLIEDNKNFGRKLDYDMNMQGYVKYHQLAIDSLYVKRKEQHFLSSDKVWYPDNWKQWEKLCEMTGECRRDCPGGAK